MSSKKAKATPPEAEEIVILQQCHPSEDRSHRFPLDQQLRKHGFKIFSRPNNCQPYWLLNEVIFSQEEAVLRLSKEELSHIKHQELLYCKGK